MSLTHNTLHIKLINMRKLFLTLTLILLCNIGFSQNVIDPKLQEILNKKGDEMININIIFKSQIELTKLRCYNNAALDKQTKRNILVDELKLFSEKKQQEVLSILQAETRNQNVSNIRSYWLSNAISCTTNRNVIYLLAEHPDIQFIGYDEMIYMIPEEDQPIDIISATREEPDLTDNIIMVNADKVWDLGYTGKGIIVAVIDSGVNYNHNDLKDHLWDGGAQYPNHGYNVIDNNNDPMDYYGHGTHCAGTVCGDGTSGILTGIAPDATLMCVKALDNSGSGSASSINAAMEFAVENHADILSMSLGFPNSNTANKAWLRNTCVNTLELGVIASVAAGNHGKNATPQMQVPNNVLVPGMCPPPWLHPDQQVNAGGLSCVVCVGAIDYFMNEYENGSKGPVTWTDTEFNDYPYGANIGLIRPDVCAPGVGVKSLDHDNNNSYNLRNGTSMAAPCVAGVMALMLEKQRDLSPADICMTLETTAYKLTEKKDNFFGTGLIDAYKAVTSLAKGSLSLTEVSINDSDFNNNGQINPGENVKLSIKIHNDSEETYSNIKAVLSCNNDMVTITKEETNIEKIDAKSDYEISNELEISIDKGIDYNSTLYFTLNLYDKDETLAGLLPFSLDMKSSDLEFASFVIKNDNNDNGILEVGETAELGVVINNIGNEIAVKVKGTLSSSSNAITINKNEAEFSTIGINSSGIAWFNVTVAENTNSLLDIPFEINTTDAYNNEYTFNGNYINSCTYTFKLNDYYKDGWDGALLLVKYSNGKETDSLTIEEKGEETYTITLEANVGITLEWISGKYDDECSFTIYAENGDIVYTSPTLLTNGTLFSWINDCSCQNEYHQLCDAVENLNGKFVGNDIVLNWTSSNSQQSTVFEVYRGSTLITTTKKTTFTDTGITKDEYIYSVRAIYNDCNSLFSDVTVKYNESTIENYAIEASIYPNPSKNNFTILCDDMTYITVYNVIGNKVMETKVGGNSLIINGLDAGIYFVDIKTNEGNIVKRILKF